MMENCKSYFELHWSLNFDSKGVLANQIWRRATA